MRSCLGTLDQDTFTYRWTHPDPRMDLLQETLAIAVTDAAEKGEDAVVTFDRVRALADEAAGAAAHASVAARLDPHRARPPRMTEPWFC